jgi:hypothetical protein
MKNNVELDPKCIKGEIGFAVTNRGHLIPCCRLDTPKTMRDPKFQKLLEVSQISKVNSVEEILSTNEWISFLDGLKKNEGPDECFNTCNKHKLEKDIQIIKEINLKENKIIRIDSR